MDPGWRRWLLGGSALAVLLTAGVVLSVQNQLPEGWASAGSEADIKSQGVVYLDEEEVFVLWQDGELLAFSDASPHIEDERIVFCRSGRFFVAPHGEKFTWDGQWIGGPATSDLLAVPVRVEDGDVLVEYANIGATEDRGPGAPFPDTDESPQACFLDTVDEGPPGFVAES